jgi:hypothetical protein
MKPTFELDHDDTIIRCRRPAVEEVKVRRQEALKTGNLRDMAVCVWLDLALRFVEPGQMACGGLFDTSLMLIGSGNARFFSTEGLRVQMMARNRCHWNDPDATGFALARGMWRRHSWKMDGARIVETTTGTNEQYYDVLLDDTTRGEFAAFCGSCP